nr:MAG TPA: hypothetical protein [Caudoviricetes sp.]
MLILSIFLNKIGVKNARKVRYFLALRAFIYHSETV